MSDLSQSSVRDLIADLAQVEDGLRRASTFEASTDGSPQVSLDLLELLDREQQIVGELRCRHVDAVP